MNANDDPAVPGLNVATAVLPNHGGRLANPVVRKALPRHGHTARLDPVIVEDVRFCPPREVVAP